MGEDQKKIEQEKLPEKPPRAASLKSGLTPASTTKGSEKIGRLVSVSGSGKTVDLAELKENERRFRTIFEAAPIGIVMTDPEGYFLQVNSSFQNIVGYNQNELQQFTFIDITHPEDRPATTQLKNKVRDGKINSYCTEKRYLRKDGQSVRVIVRATAIRDQHGDIKYWLGLMEDLTERKKAELAIRQSEEKYRNILEGMEEGYFEVDLRGNLTFFNDAMCKILGYSADELMTTNNREYTKHCL